MRKNEILKLISDGKLLEAIDNLELFSLEKLNKKHDSIHNLKFQYKEVNTNEINGIIDRQQISVEKNRIVTRILNLFDQIESEEGFENSSTLHSDNEENKNIEESLRGNWKTYRQRIDVKNSKLRKSTSRNNITTTELVFYKDVDSKEKYLVSTIFMAKVFTGVYKKNGQFLYIDLIENEGARKVSLSIDLERSIEKESQYLILKGIAITFISDEREKVDHPLISIPIVIEKIGKDVTSYDPRVDHISLSNINNHIVRETLQKNKNFVSILPERKSRKILYGFLFSIASCLILFYILYSPFQKEIIINSTFPRQVGFIWEEYEKFAKEVRIASEGKITFIFKEVNDKEHNNQLSNVQKTNNQALLSVPYYDFSQNGLSAANFLCNIPFGMSEIEFQSWMSNDGKELYINHFVKKYNIRAIPFGSTGVQSGGWFSKEITEIKDFDSLAMRIYNPAQRVMENTFVKYNLSFNTSLLTGLPNLERVTKWEKLVDSLNLEFAFEAVNPAVDSCLGLFDYAKIRYKNGNGKMYFYEYGWQEPHTQFSLFINNDLWNEINEYDPKLANVILLIADKYHRIISDKFKLYGEQTLERWKAIHNEESNQDFPIIIIDSFDNSIIGEFHEQTLKLIENKRRAEDSNIVKSYLNHDSKLSNSIYNLNSVNW